MPTSQTREQSRPAHTDLSRRWHRRPRAHRWPNTGPARWSPCSLGRRNTTMQTSTVSNCRQPAHRVSTTANDSADTLLALVMAIRTVSSNAACNVCEKSYTNRADHRLDRCNARLPWHRLVPPHSPALGMVRRYVPASPLQGLARYAQSRPHWMSNATPSAPGSVVANAAARWPSRPATISCRRSYTARARLMRAPKFPQTPSTMTFIAVLPSAMLF